MPLMINRSTKFLSVALATLALACSSPKQAPREPVAPSAVELAAKPAPAKPAPSYTLALTNGWSLVHSEPLEGDEPMLLAVYENELDEEVTLVGGVIGIPLTPEQADSFYEQMRDGAHEQEGVRIVKERMVKVGGVPAYEYAAVVATRGGPMAHVGLVATNGKVGYLVRCGGPLDAAQIVLPACSKFVESFRVAK